MRQLLCGTVWTMIFGSLLVAQKTPAPQGPAPKPVANLTQALRADGSHQIFLTLMEIAGFNFTDELKTATGQETPPPCPRPAGLCDSSYTVFAPRDEAFAKLPPGTLDALKKDPAKARQFVRAHVVTTGGSPSEGVDLNGKKVAIAKSLNGKADVFSGGTVRDVDAVLVDPRSLGAK